MIKPNNKIIIQRYDNNNKIQQIKNCGNNKKNYCIYLNKCRKIDKTEQRRIKASTQNKYKP